MNRSTASDLSIVSPIRTPSARCVYSSRYTIGMRFAALLFLTSLSVQAQSPCANTPGYSYCEITFELPAGQADPYKTVDLKAEFRSPRHRTFGMPGFWAGGNRMIIRFTPTEAGDWDYRVTSNVKEFD